MKIFVHQVVGDHCLTVADGRRLYKHFIPELQAGREVELDFSSVCVIGSPFFNSSLGFLLRDFEMEELRRLVKVSNLDSRAQAVLNRVVKNCNRYYRSTSPVENAPQKPMLQRVNLGVVPIIFLVLSLVVGVGQTAL